MNTPRHNKEENMDTESTAAVPVADPIAGPDPLDRRRLVPGVDLRIGIRPSGMAGVLVATSETDWLPIALTGSTSPGADYRKIDLRLAPVRARLLADLLETAADLADGTPRSRRMRRRGRLTRKDIWRLAMDIDQLAAPLIASDNHDNRQEE
jgi:hypothetical protein